MTWQYDVCLDAMVSCIVVLHMIMYDTIHNSSTPLGSVQTLMRHRSTKQLDSNLISLNTDVYLVPQLTSGNPLAFSVLVMNHPGRSQP